MAISNYIKQGDTDDRLLRVTDGDRSTAFKTRPLSTRIGMLMQEMICNDNENFK